MWCLSRSRRQGRRRASRPPCAPNHSTPRRHVRWERPLRVYRLNDGFYKTAPPIAGRARQAPSRVDDKEVIAVAGKGITAVTERRAARLPWEPPAEQLAVHVEGL